MQVHLSKPGGQREGPFTVEQINRDLAANKYQDEDYWAWYEGLDAWVPLHTVPGIVDSPHETSPPGEAATASALPIEALEHIFIFTPGEGPAVMESKITTEMLEGIVGADIEAIRAQAPRDVFGRCNIPSQLAAEGHVPQAAWRAMSALKPDLVKQAQAGAYRTCVRIFEIESREKVAVFLFYKKGAMEERSAKTRAG
jgi:hypothetical protein